MPWKRRGDRRYLYRSRRVGGRVVSEYVGSGALAELEAVRAERGRESDAAARAAEQERKRVEQEWQEAAERQVSEALGLAAWIMQAAGYHRHDRGRWRKRRGTMSQGTDPADGAGVAKEASTPAVPSSAAASSRPDRKDLERRLLSLFASSASSASSRTVGPLGWGPDRAALQVLANRYCGTDAEGKRSRGRLIADAEEMARGLAGPGPTPLVMVLAETAALAWAELRMAQAADHMAGGRTIAQADAAGRRVDRAHRRFLRAAKALSDVQRVNPSVLVQVNQQYNLSGEAPGPPAEAGSEGRGSDRG